MSSLPLSVDEDWSREGNGKGKFGHSDIASCYRNKASENLHHYLSKS